ncbi:helix-turn-helix domain-containing protein [Paenibacillus tritici]|uniref:Helix-turn-helix domain-containing protein n=1 Tax=Paenibacillus tritici TaxID=1873425 RepID=A0ABX2DN36_9BACL|nr:helix-turn-helix domain-containing protein [Paenibacillus tritici]NQX46078.1 helix-turn-helix domain-containing protein [Paenibacillus tritici]
MADYTDTILITKSLTHFVPEFIYVGNRSRLPDHAEGMEQASLMLINDAAEPSSGQPRQMYSGQNRIEFGAEEDVFEMYNQVRELFLEEAEREQVKGRMLQACVAGKGLDAIVSAAAELMGNPVIMLDVSYKVLASSDISGVSDPIWSDNLHKGYCSYDFIAAVHQMTSVQNGMKSIEAYEVECSGSQVTKLVAKVRIGSKPVGNIIVLGSTRPILQKDHELAGFTAELVAAELAKNSFYRNSSQAEYEELLYGLLENEENGQRLVQESLRSGKRLRTGRLSVMVLDLGRYEASGKYNGYLRDQLHLYFGEEHLIFYHEYMVGVSERDSVTAKPRDNDSKMREFLVTHQIRLGISREFTDLAECRKYYLQALKALEIGRVVWPSEPRVLYADVQLYDLLSPHAQHDPRDVSHPALTVLREYDKKHHADLYHTLYYYLKNNQQLQKTADELFVHRNTLRYRLRQIDELIQIDLSQIDNMLRLYMSYQMTDYLDKLRAAGAICNADS